MRGMGHACKGCTVSRGHGGCFVATTMKNLLTIPGLALAALLGSCTSVDVERDHMRGAIDDSKRLARDVTAWRSTVAVRADDDAVASMEGFQDRAEDLNGTLCDLSEAATAGIDLTALTKALSTMGEFDAEAYEAASPDARRAILDQFVGLAVSVERSAMIDNS